MTRRVLPVLFLFAFAAAAAPPVRNVPMDPVQPERLLGKGAVAPLASDIPDPVGDLNLRGVTPQTRTVNVTPATFHIPCLGAKEWVAPDSHCGDTAAYLFDFVVPLWLFETDRTLQWSVDSFGISGGNITPADSAGPGTFNAGGNASNIFDTHDPSTRGDLDILGAEASVVFGTNVTSFVRIRFWVTGPASTTGSTGGAYVVNFSGLRNMQVQIDAFRGVWWESVYGFGPGVVDVGPHYDIARGRAWVEGSDLRLEMTVAGNLPSMPNPDLGIPEYQWVFSGSQHVIRYTWTQNGGWQGVVAGNAQAPLTMSHSGGVVTARVPLAALGLPPALQWAGYTDSRIEKFGYPPWSTNILDSVPDSGYGDTETLTPPAIVSLLASPQRVRRGSPVTLLWSTTGADSVEIGGLGTFPARAGTTVTPQETTTFVMTATGDGGSAVGEVTVAVITEPIVAVSEMPAGMIQAAGGTAATDAFVLTNAGGGPESVQLTTSGNFFSLDANAFSLAPGQSRTVQLTSTATAAGEFAGTVRVQGTNQVLNVPVRLLVTPPPVAAVDPSPQNPRVDVSAPPGGAPGGFAVFENRGAATLHAVVVSDVPWIVPQASQVSIPPNGTAHVNFTVNRALRGDSGAAVGSLSLRYLQAAPAKGDVGGLNGVTPSTSTVRVIDTVTPVATASSVPPLAPGERRLLLTGVGHLVGSVGVFLSDIAFVNLGAANLSNVESWFRPSNPAQPTLRAGLASIGPSQPIAFNDMIAGVYGYESHAGTLHVRASDPDALALVGTVLAVSDPRGTYGTTIPLLRTDRGVAPGERTWVPGVKRDDTVHTNLYLQETAGTGVTAVVTSHREDGTALGSTTETLEAFGMKQLQNVAPAGAAYFVVRNEPASPGRLLAYATPVDRGSGDTWSYTDWPRLLGYGPTEGMLIPIAGTVRGANDTFFRTGLGVVNAGSSTGSASFLYRDRTGSSVQRTITLAPGEAYTTDDLIAELFNLPDQAIGHVVVTPASGAWVVNSRTYNTSPGSPATYGSASPTLPLSASRGIGEFHRFGAIEDAGVDAINARSGSTYRTNLGLIETAGAPATVRVTMQYAYAASTTLTVKGSVSKDYNLGPNGFLLLNRISRELMGDEVRSGIGDLTDLVLEVLVVDGTGRVAAFTSSVDNGTGDSILRVE